MREEEYLLKFCPRCGEYFEKNIKYCPECDKEGMNVSLMDGLFVNFLKKTQNKLKTEEKFESNKERLKKSYDNKYYYRDRKITGIKTQTGTYNEKFIGIIGSIFFLLFAIFDFIQIFNILINLKDLFICLELIFLILGVIFMSIAMNIISKKVNNPLIFPNYILFVVFWFVGILLFPIFNFFNNYFVFYDEVIITVGYINFGAFLIFIVNLIQGFLLIIACFLINKSFKNTSWSYNNELFKITGIFFIVTAFLIFGLSSFQLIILTGGIIIMISFLSYIFLLISASLQIAAFALIPDKINIKNRK